MDIMMKKFLPFLAIGLLMVSCGKSRRDLITIDRKVSSLNISGQTLDQNTNASFIESCKVTFKKDSTYHIEIPTGTQSKGKWQLDEKKGRILSFPENKQDTVVYKIQTLNKKQMTLATRDANVEMTITLKKSGKK